MALAPITINIPIEIDAGSFTTSTTVQGETVTYSKVHLPLLYRTVQADPTVQNIRDTFQFKEAEDQTLVTVDISGGAIGTFANGMAVVKGLFKAALDGTALTSIAMTSGVIYSDGTARNTETDPLEFYADKDTHTVGTGTGSNLKAYLLEYLYDNLSKVIGLAAQTGTLDITLSRDGDSASEIIAEALAIQLCGSGNSEQNVAAAALRQNIYEQMFTLAPERFAESTLMRQDPAGNIAYQDLPFQENDTMAFLVTFKFPASQISAPVVANAIRTSESSVFVDTGSKISVAAGTNATNSLQNLLEDFPDCTVMMRVQLTDGKTAPDAPTNLTVTSGDGQVEIAFTAGSDNGSAITNYKYSLDGGVTYTALSPADSVSPIVVTGLTNGTEYQIKLRAVNSIGDGAESVAVTATTAAAPLAPTGLSATPGNGQITVSFTAGADNGAAITNYKYSIDGGVSYIAFSPADVSSPVVITGLTNGVSYSVKLRAVNNAGDGAESAAVSATPASVPAAPTGLNPTRGDTQATITFTAGFDGGSAITNYKYSIDNGASYVAFSPADAASPVTITSLTNGVTYQVKLRPVNAVGDGAESAAVSVTPSAPNWTQRGLDIDGEAGNDYSGSSVSISDNGLIVAIAAPYNDGNGNNSGQVRVYEWNGASWIKRGADIDGEAADDSGLTFTFRNTFVSLNSNGSVVAIGAELNDGNGNVSGHVRIYGWNGTAWIQRGADIDGIQQTDFSGYSVSLDETGTIVAIGAPYQNFDGNGYVRVFTWNGSTWSQRGSNIVGEAAGDLSGICVSLSKNGSVLAIGAPQNDGVAFNSGHVRVYNWNGTAWIQRGADIDGLKDSDQSGNSVSLNYDGTILAVGAYWGDGAHPTYDKGHVRVFTWNGSAWIQQGSTIIGEANDDQSGWSVSLNREGNLLAIGARNNDGTTGNSSDDRGHVRVYSWNGSAWTQMGSDLDGESAGDRSGCSVAIAGSTTTVAIGANQNDGNGVDSGHVRVYTWA